MAPDARPTYTSRNTAGCIYLDVADDHWRAVEIAPNGWRVFDNPPVHFAGRPDGCRSPCRNAGGSLEALRSLLNLPSHDDFVLVVA